MNITSTKGAGVDSLNVLIYGESGAGKTYLASTTGDAKTLIISAERGLLTLADQDIPVFDINGQPGMAPMNALQLVFQALKSGSLADTRWVIIDSISEVAEACLAAEMAKGSASGNQAHGMKAYGEMQDRITRIVRSFRDLPMHVVMLAKQGRVQDDSGRTWSGPSMPGKKLSEGIAYHFDEVFALQVVPDAEDPTKSNRWLLTAKTDTHVAKDRSDQLDTWEPANLGFIHTKITAAQTAKEQ